MLTVSHGLREHERPRRSPTRRGGEIFERLAEHPQAGVELARDLPVSRPAVSQHLKVLHDPGWSSTARMAAPHLSRRSRRRGRATRLPRPVLEPSPDRLQGGRRATPMRRSDDHAGSSHERARVDRRRRRRSSARSRCSPRTSAAGGRPTTTSSRRELAEMVFEPRAGRPRVRPRRRRQRVPAGRACSAYEPPERVVFSWDIGLHWEIETDPRRRARSRSASSRRARPHARRARAPQHRAPRRGLGEDARRGRLTGRLAARLIEAFAERLRK